MRRSSEGVTPPTRKRKSTGLSLGCGRLTWEVRRDIVIGQSIFRPIWGINFVPYYRTVCNKQTALFREHLIISSSYYYLWLSLCLDTESLLSWTHVILWWNWWEWTQTKLNGWCLITPVLRWLTRGHVSRCTHTLIQHMQTHKRMSHVRKLSQTQTFAKKHYTTSLSLTVEF